MKRTLGFTLIEVMIAMMIIAIAFTAILKATEDALSSSTHLQSRIVAHWVAEEILIAAEVGSLILPSENRNLNGVTLMLGQQYQWVVTNQPTNDKDIHQLTVSVTQNQQPLYTLTGSLLLNNNNGMSLLLGGLRA
jgi:general secretion pathway protein I